MVTFIIVTTVLYVLQSIILICIDFRETTITRNTRKLNFFVGVGFMAWGFILLLRHYQ